MALQGDLVVPFELVSVDVLSTPLVDPFPGETSVIATLSDLDLDLEFVGVSHYLAGVVHSEGTHLEPTVGQIWPR